MNRMERMLQLAELQAGEGVLIHKPSNMFYLSGYTGEGLIAAGNGFQVLMVDRGVNHAQLAYRLFKEHGVAHVRYEDDQVTVRSFERIRQAMPDIAFARSAEIGHRQGKLKQFSQDCVLRLRFYL